MSYLMETTILGGKDTLQYVFLLAPKERTPNKIVKYILRIGY